MIDGDGMLISLHLPKTAGTSFRSTLLSHFGATLYQDYRDWPDQHPASRNLAAVLGAVRVPFSSKLRGMRCVHGHFLALKYGPLIVSGRARAVTWLRHPVERLVSHYHHWQRTYDVAGDAKVFPLHARMIEERWSLARFCLGPELRNLYRAFLWGMGIRWFRFVGVTEHYAEDLAAFGERFLGGAAVTCHHENSGEPCSEGRAMVSKALRAAIERHHAADMALYAQALRLRERRIQPGVSMREGI